jgi:predicted MFS family arabinose efflux permease
LATIGLGGIIFGLIESSNRGWSDPVVIAALLLGLFALAAFVAVETRKQAPLLPIFLFHERNFAGANLLTLFLYGALSATFFFFPLNLIQVQGYTATAAASALLPFIALMFLLSRWSGKLVDRYGARRPLVLGPTVTAVGFALFAAPSIGGSYWTTFFPAVIVLGLGMALSVAPLTTTVMNSVGAERAGIASGVNNAVSRVAAVLAIALFGIVMLGTFSRHLNRELEQRNISSATRQEIEAQRNKLAAMKVPAELRGSVNESFVAGFRVVMSINVALALASAASAALMIRDER